jgi:hypothetical protein
MYRLTDYKNNGFLVSYGKRKRRRGEGGVLGFWGSTLSPSGLGLLVLVPRRTLGFNVPRWTWTGKGRGELEGREREGEGKDEEGKQEEARETDSEDD